MCNWSEGIIERALAKANAHAAKYVEEHMVEINRWRAENEEVRAELEQRKKALEQGQAEFEQSRAEIEQSRVEIEQRTTEIEQSKAEIERRATEIEQKYAEVAAREQQLAERTEQSLSQGEILGAIGVYQELGLEKTVILSKITEKFSISREEAEKYLKRKGN